MNRHDKEAPTWFEEHDFLDPSSYVEGDEMPIFPLNVVLFPKMPLPLQVFEPRYHEMIQSCIAGSRKFGVALISEGQEVNGPAEVWPVGTVAHIEQVERLEDGRLKILTIGTQRFQILHRLPDDPYPRAIVSILEEQPDEKVEDSLLQEAQDLLLKYLKSIARQASRDWEELSTPDDPVLLGYIVGAVLPCSLEEKQELLQAVTAADRLRKELPMLRREVERLESPVVHRFEPTIRLSPN